MLNLHTKGELQRLPCGLAGRLGDVATWRRPSLDGLDRPLESVVRCSAFSTWFLGRPASPRPVDLALARLGLLLPCHVDPGSCDASQFGSGFR